MQTFTTARTALFPEITARKIFDLIRDELGLVEAEYERQVRSNVQVVNYLGEYLRASGGKRVRPALLILANHAVGGTGHDKGVIRMATVMEMLHTATLVHDDIIDNAGTRRSEPSVNARFGNQAAVLMGDWLYMSAFETSLRARSLEILDILTRLTRKMTEGELIQLTMIGRLDISEDDYFDILRRKTAYLFSACGEIGGILGGASQAGRSALAEYGMNLGVAFQLADDLLDFTSDEQVLGKAAGADLIEGKLTLPLILLQKKDPEVRHLLEQIIRAGRYEGPLRDRLMQRINDHGILDDVRARAHQYAGLARKNLEVLPETEYCSALEQIAEYVVERHK